MFHSLRQVLQGNNSFNNCEFSDQEECENQPPIKLRSSGYKREHDGSVTLSVTLDKDQVECCVCFSSMTGMIYRCHAQGNICHNVCAPCEWQIRRMKNISGHTKISTCPICKTEGQFIRNRALEKQLHDISKPCKNHNYGCEIRYFEWDENSQNIHLKKCMFEPVTCPFCFESIPGGRANFVEHLRLASSKFVWNQNKFDINRHESNTNLIGYHIENNSENIDDNDSDNSLSRVSRFFGRRLNSNDRQRFRHFMFFQNSRQSNSNQNNQNLSMYDVHEDEKVSLDNNSDNQNNFHNNYKSNESSKLFPKIKGCNMEFKEAQLSIDSQKYATFVLTRENTFVVNFSFGYVMVFLKPDDVCPCWKVYCISIAPHHGIAGNNRVYLQYQSNEDNTKYLQLEQQQGLSSDSLLRPVCNTLQLSMGRLAPEFFYRKKKLAQIEQSCFSFSSLNDATCNHNALLINGNEQKCDETDDGSSVGYISSNRSQLASCRSTDSNFRDNDVDTPCINLEDGISDSDELDLDEINPSPFLAKSPCTSLQVGYIYAGMENMPYSFRSMQIRLFTLEESIKVGTIIDARDFTGKWYQAEILKVADSSLQESSVLQDSDPLLTRRCKIHYLGYSANYDEWLNIDTDSHRIAQRGIYTVGPDLRAARRYAGRQVQMPGAQSLFPRVLLDNVDVENNNLSNMINDEANA